MIGDAVLEQGIAKGIVSSEQVRALRTLAQEMAAQDTALPAPEPEDDEKLRFITGFGDIFVTIGIGLFTGAVAYFAYSWADGRAMWASLAIAAWLLAEYFTRRRRMALPSIVLLCLFAASVFQLGRELAANYLFNPPGLITVETVFSGWHLAVGWYGKMNLTVTASVTLAAVVLYYWRFRVPITIAVGAAAVVGIVFGAIGVLAPEFWANHFSPLILISGLGIFAFAMHFDVSDPARVTRRADTAFWLHMLAAPLIVHPLISRFVGEGEALGMITALSVLGLFVLLGAVAVIVDRRAMLVSGLVYAGYASAALIKQTGLEDYTFPATLLVLGGFILLLSAGWRPSRTALLKLLPVDIARRLPHPLLSS